MSEKEARAEARASDEADNIIQMVLVTEEATHARLLAAYFEDGDGL